MMVQDGNRIRTNVNDTARYVGYWTRNSYSWGFTAIFKVKESESWLCIMGLGQHDLALQDAYVCTVRNGKVSKSHS